MARHQGGKLTPNLDQQSTKILNLTVLQRIDPCIEEILLTASHVTFYEFNIELNQWSRKDVEGSLFVVKRNGQPRFQFVVMNRRSTDNLVEDLLGDFEYEVQVPYLLYRNASQEVNGIWFYNSHECKEVANLFSRILDPYSKVPPKPKVSATRSEFEELEKVPTTAVIEGPLEPSSTTSTTADVLEDSSFINFFNSAINIRNNASIVTTSGQPYHSLSPALRSSHVSSVLPSPATSSQVLPLPLSTSSTPPVPFHGTQDPFSNANWVTNLVKPSTFIAPLSSTSTLMTSQSPISSSLPTAALHHPLNLQRQFGTPMLQHFPPPTPSPSLTPISTCAPNYGPSISRDKVHDAVLMLVQDNQFIEMVYQALLKVHNPL